MLRSETRVLPPAVLAAWAGLASLLSANAWASDQVAAEPPRASDKAADEHWSIRPVVPGRIPTPDRRGWSVNPIDAFVLEGYAADQLAPNPAADRATLIRRVTYGLTGLPPTVEAVQAFVEDGRPQAYQRLVDRLLASPAYGEKWARYWLDLVRFAETNSYERDGDKPNAFRYRDYVIAAFNQNKPYDQFVLEQLAGDELDEVTSDSITATGYYRLGIWDDEPVDGKQAHFDNLDDILATTSQVFLGLSLNCARCHDHKLDPIPQEDYYRFLAFFAGVNRLGGPGRGRNIEQHSLRDVQVAADDPAYVQQVAAYEAELAQVGGALAKLDENYAASLPPGARDDFAFESNRLDVLASQIGESLTQQEFNKYKALRERFEKLRAAAPNGRVKALSVSESGSEPPPTHLLYRGNAHAPREVVEPGFPRVLGCDDPEVAAPPDGKSSGRRRALAEWLVAKENPLTARVFVNRIWQHHFGAGLVRTPNDFGWQGDSPSHPELLDWLAAEFVDRGWDVKWLQRTLTTSATYRMGSRARPGPLASDPLNRRLWRFPSRRLSAEEVRDSILAVTGSLNRQMHGPSIYPLIADEVKAGQSRPGHGWHDSAPNQRTRRSVYVFSKRSLMLPIFQSFDAPDADFTCPVRVTSLQPTQALELMNGAFVQHEAAALARDLARIAPGNPRGQIEVGLGRVLQRTPTPAEIDRGVELIDVLQSEERMSADRALAAFCVTALSLNEFMFVD